MTSDPRTTFMPPLARKLLRLKGQARRVHTTKTPAPTLENYWRARYPRYQLAPHIRLMIETLAQLQDGEGLIITLPPRHSKTETVKAWLEWQIGQQPEQEAMYCSYSIRLARTSSRSVRNEIATGLAFTRFFPNTWLARDATASTDWATAQGGMFRAAGVGGSITGMGARRAVIDDPIKDRKAAESEIVREGVWEWFTSAFLTRLTPDAIVVLTHTRWHPDDLAGKILRKLEEDKTDELGGIRWQHLNLPALAEENDPLNRDVGQPLWPERFNLERLHSMRMANEYDFEALYQQRPRKRGGQVFSDSPARYESPRLDGGRIIIAADTASSQRKTADYTAFCVLFQSVSTNPRQTAGEQQCTAERADILEVVRGRFDLAMSTATALDLQQRYGAEIILEETSQSLPIIQHMRLSGVRVRGVRPVGDKYTRAMPAATAWNSGRIRAPANAPPWLPDLLTELASFTGTSADEHDDQVDALAYAWQEVVAAGGNIISFN